jgi:hypothetical protein
MKTRHVICKISNHTPKDEKIKSKTFAPGLISHHNSFIYFTIPTPEIGFWLIAAVPAERELYCLIDGIFQKTGSDMPGISSYPYLYISECTENDYPCPILPLENDRESLSGTV